MIFRKQICEHNPIGHEYGDCLRTVIACLLDMEPDTVPHFAHDGAEGQTVWDRADEWLAERGLATWRTAYAGGTLDEILQTVNAANPGTYYMLMGRGGGNAAHIVICLGDDIAHDPSPFGVGLRGPFPQGEHGELRVVITLIPLRLKA